MSGWIDTEIKLFRYERGNRGNRRGSEEARHRCGSGFGADRDLRSRNCVPVQGFESGSVGEDVSAGDDG